MGSEIMLFFVNTHHQLAGNAPKKTTTTVTCDKDALLSSVFRQLFDRYQHRFPETYEDVSVDDFIGDVGLIYAGKKVHGYDERSISDLGIGDEATLHEVRKFGASRCSYQLGKPRRQFKALKEKDNEAAMLDFHSRLPRGNKSIIPSAPSLASLQNSGGSLN